MIPIFEGSRQATEFAQTESKKQKTNLYVIKSMAGGINYQVRKSAKLGNGEKLLASFNDKGEKTSKTKTEE